MFQRYMLFIFLTQALYAEIIIRPALEGDLENVMQLDREISWEYFKPLFLEYTGLPLAENPDTLLEEDLVPDREMFIHAIKNTWLYIACENTKIIGFIAFSREQATVNIDLLLVHKDYRNKKVGKGLLNTALTAFNDIETCTLIVLDKNISARKLYESYGFVLQEMPNDIKQHFPAEYNYIYLFYTLKLRKHKAAAQSLEAYEYWLNQFEGARCEKSPTMTFWRSPIKDPALNIVTRYTPDDPTKISSDIDAIASWARTNHTPISWILEENIYKKDIEQHLQKHGFTHVPLMLMVHELQQIPDAVSDTIKCISSEDLPNWLEAFNDAFGELSQALKSVMESDLIKPNKEPYSEHYGGYLNNKLVTTGSLFITPNYAELSDIGTRKEARNKGMATIMVVTLLNRAKKLQVPYVILTAEQEAQNIYKKAGFVPVARADRYILEKENNETDQITHSHLIHKRYHA